MEFANNQSSAKIKSKIVELFSNMDLNIKPYRVERVPLNKNKFNVKVITEHIIGIQKYELDLQEESNGTKKNILATSFVCCSYK